MKKALAFLVVGFVFFGSCSVQNANAQSSNDAQRIVGSWKASDNDGESWIYTFNADGTYTYSQGYSGKMSNSNGKYFVSGSILFYHRSDGESDVSSSGNFYISPNGRVLVYGSKWFEKQ